MKSKRSKVVEESATKKTRIEKIEKLNEVDKKGNGMKTSKTKRVLAIIGVAILLGLYLFSLIAAILAKPYANGLFLSSVFATFIIPIFIYVFLLMNRTFGKKKEGYSVHELNQMKKENKKNEMEEANQSKK